MWDAETPKPKNEALPPTVVLKPRETVLASDVPHVDLWNIEYVAVLPLVTDAVTVVENDCWPPSPDDGKSCHRARGTTPQTRSVVAVGGAYSTRGTFPGPIFAVQFVGTLLIGDVVGTVVGIAVDSARHVPLERRMGPSSGVNGRPPSDTHVSEMVLCTNAPVHWGDCHKVACKRVGARIMSAHGNTYAAHGRVQVWQRTCRVLVVKHWYFKDLYMVPLNTVTFDMHSSTVRVSYPDGVWHCCPPIAVGR